MREIRIGVDCRLAGLKHAGIGRYIKNLVIRLPKLDSKITWVYFFSDSKQAKEVLGTIFNAPNIKKIYVPIRHYTLAEQLKLPWIFLKEKLTILHVPHFNVPLFYPGRIVVTIHDLLWHQHRGRSVTTLKSWVYWPKYLAYRLVASDAIRKAEKIFVPAQAIKRTLTNYYPFAKDKVVVTNEGAGEEFEQERIEVEKKIKSSTGLTQLAQQHQRSRQLIYTGSLYPHKNVKLVIDALKFLPEFTLKIVGSRNVFQDVIREHARERELGKRVVFVGYLSDQQLIKEYRRSFALVQPSLSEGFGLTGVEAMCVGLPVIASDIEVFREIYQDAAVFFNPSVVRSFAQQLDVLLGSNQKNQIQKGLRVSREYSWQKMVETIFRELQ